jgi:two-component system, chemotaxis family, protein-glutamate methylesterase/glutaminase
MLLAQPPAAGEQPACLAGMLRAAYREVSQEGPITATMSTSYVVVVGASAGGVAALQELVRHLPRDLPAAVFVVLHTAPNFDSMLPQILSRAGTLPVAHARGGEPLRAGTITVAPPDRHLLIRADRVELSHGPRENHARPAVDPALRSAARAHGAAVVGVLLSGTLGDGTMGLMAVKARGGVTIVQDPSEAAYTNMPEHALRFVEVDHVLPVQEIAATVVRHAQAFVERKEVSQMEDAHDRVRRSIGQDFVDQVHGRRVEQESIYTCPDCGGVLWQSQEGPATAFSCYQGHSYAPERLLTVKSEALENALWSATRALVERATLNRQLARQLRERGLEQRAAHLEERADLDETNVRLLRGQILQADEAEPRTRKVESTDAA